MAFIAHLSDFHVGAQEFNEQYLLDAINKANELNPDVVIVTGDITEHGYYLEHEKAAEFLELIDAPTLVVPGNHDARHVGDECFEELIKQRYGTLKINDPSIKIIGLDSSEPDLDEGKIGRSQQIWLERELKKLQNRSIYKIIALHHHIIPVPKTGRERNILTDAGDILQSVINGGANLVLSGHKHMPHVWLLGETTFATAGTVSSFKIRGNMLPSFNTIDIQEDFIEIVLNQSDGKHACLARFENICFKKMPCKI